MNSARHVTLTRLVAWLGLGLGLLLFVFSIIKLENHARDFPPAELQVVLPRFVQIGMTAGDRYLAANVAVVRSLLNPFKSDAYDNFLVQARLQTDAAWLNPRHEDNYYVAAAMLSWSAHFNEANYVLEQAAQSRPFDMLPPLYLGFNHFYFDRDSATGSHWMYEAARRSSDEQMRTSLTRIASRWAERGQNAVDAVRMVEVMIQQARSPVLKRYLQARLERLEVQVQLQQAAKAYLQKTGRPLARLDDLVTSGILSKIPVDPQGLGYEVIEGEVMLKHEAIKGPPQPKRVSQ